VQPAQALARAKTFEKESNGALSEAVVQAYAKGGTLAEWAYVRDKFDAARPQGQFNLMEPMAAMVGRLNDPTVTAEGIDRLKTMGVKYKMYGADKPIIELLQGLTKSKDGAATADATKQAVDKAVGEIEAAK
jgi:aminopeptidase N